VTTNNITKSQCLLSQQIIIQIVFIYPWQRTCSE